MNLHYLGPEGSFSHIAAVRLRDNLGSQATLMAMPTVEKVVRTVASTPVEEGALGLVPYYNFLEGLVQEHLDLIYEFQLQVVSLLRVPIEFSAGGYRGEGTADCAVYSHAKALAQCSDFIYASIGNAVLKPVSSTSDAARLVSEQKQGIAIASKEALQKFNLPVLYSDVGNRRHGKSNFTDFFVVSKAQPATPGEGRGDIHTLVAIIPQINRLGLLAEILGQFRFYELDIAKIHSRPALDAVDETEEPQMFYLEVRCSPEDESFRRCAAAIQYRFERPESPTRMFRVLGAFRI